MGKTEGRHIITLFPKPIQRAIKERGFSILTEPQVKAIPLILEGKNVLLIAPTGTGKTEAAFLPVLSLFLQMPERPLGVKILYITPLRALNRDLLERLEWWCKKLDVKVAIRHGDTEISERSKQARSPPDMLITTPETLQAILPGRVMRRHLRAVRWVIVDEIHELAGDKRGSQLSLALERLRWITLRDFQVVGLSATIGTPEKVAQYLVGSNRQCTIVKVPVARYMQLKILFPQPTTKDIDLAAKLYTHPEVAARLSVMRDLIENHASVLLFTNTRAIAEVLASRFKVWDVDFPVSIHHGSLAKPARITAERGLKQGELKGLVCTSSLELGIDIGRVDLCIQYNSPRQVTRLLQRVGRSGHRVGRIAKGAIITMDSDDTLEAMVISRRALQEDLEPVLVPDKPLDALTHQIVGLLTQKKRWHFSEVLDLFTQAYPYRDLTEEDLIKVLTYMHTRYPRLAWVSFDDKVILRPQRIKELYKYYFENLSMIPDEKQYLVVDQTSDTPIGVLDEAFVAEYGEPGTKFIVRGSAWKIIHVYGDHIYVKPADDPTGAIPSWVGEEIPVPYEVALEVGEIRRYTEDQLKNGKKPEEVVLNLSAKYPADKEVIFRAIIETVDQVRKGYPLPTDKRITLEDWEDYVVIQASFGSLVNRTLARLIGHILSEKTGYTIGVQQDPYRIVIQTFGTSKSEDVRQILLDLPNTDVENIAVQATTKTGLFKRRMVHVARKFGALSKWVDFSNISLRQLMKSFEGTAIYDEAIKETLQSDMDIEHTVEVLNKIRSGEIEVVCLKTMSEATPIARVGIERISRKTDLIPPEKMKRILIESARARILNEVRTFVCTNCWEFIEMLRMRDLPSKLKCPKCGSDEIGVLEETEEVIRKLCEKKGKNLSEREKEIQEKAIETAQLISKYGRTAAMVLAGHRIRPSDAEIVLLEEHKLTDNLFELIVEAERKALKRRFW
ncbi:DEAD/DEAH box helicase [Candidatus Bathyarchaeota archaeon]|nr:DEAD/DEAH box helicase [Candidatus Bathyarchaeota archaeon]